MMKKIILLIPILLIGLISCAQNTITVNGTYKPDAIGKQVVLSFISDDSLKVSGYSSADTLAVAVKNGKFSAVLKNKGPLWVHISTLNKAGYVFLEPGDKINIEGKETQFKISGKGSDKFNFALDADRSLKELHPPTDKKGSSYTSKTLDSYQIWDRYLKEKCDRVFTVAERYKSLIDANILDMHCARLTSTTVLERLNSMRLFGLEKEATDATTRLKLADRLLNDFYVKWFLKQGNFNVINSYFYLHLDRKNEFGKSDNYSTKHQRRDYFITLASEKLSQKAMNGWAAKFLVDQIMTEMGFGPDTENLIVTCYAMITDQFLLSWVKSKEALIRSLTVNGIAPDFELADATGKLVSKKDFQGKVILMDFWFTGCAGCIQMTPALKKLEHEFAQDTNVIFLSISIDKDREQWLSSVRQGNYTTGTGVNLYTGGIGDKHKMLKDYNIHGYPNLFLIDGLGKGFKNPVPDPREEKGAQQLRELIKKAVVLSNDGPYLFHTGDSVIINSFIGSKYKRGANTKSSVQLNIGTDKYHKQFTSTLQKELRVQETETIRPDKMIVFSDIEGNFDSFRKLLQANKIIDQNFNWTFGQGHLVFSGDMFDRGDQVTECLWLIYSLEEKALAQKGKVHFILGNHEIMNLQPEAGKSKYVRPKYLMNAAKMNRKLNEVYGEDSELGRWLRTKNVVEKAGDILFTHGGLSPEIKNSDLTLASINTQVRLYLDKGAESYPDNSVRLVMSTTAGPFWYRGYYKNSANGEASVDSILNKYGAKHIITGHTIVADTISVLYNNKVINTDVPHAKGKSEALLIEGRTFYRVDDKGERKLLFKEPEEDVKIDRQ